MDLRHYTTEPMTFHRDLVYIQRLPRMFGKPEGLWVSVLGEDDWPTWCRDNRYEPEGLVYEYKVILRPDAKVHCITNLYAFDAFHGTYSVQEEPFRPGLSTEYQCGQRPIDWREVATDCDGVIIAPYQWERRLLPSWYYGWDCASGCIWNLEAIESVE